MLIATFIVFHKLEVEQCEVVYQLINSIIPLLAKSIVFTDEATCFQVVKNSSDIGTTRQSYLF